MARLARGGVFGVGCSVLDGGWLEWGGVFVGLEESRTANIVAGFGCMGDGAFFWGDRRAANIAAGIDPGTGSAVNVGYKSGGLEKMEGLPYAFGRFGYVGGTTFYSLSALGAYWSGSTVSSERSFALDYNDSVLYPAYQYYRGDGRSVRCVAR